MIRSEKIIYEDLGLKDYQKAWNYQEQLFAQIIDLKLRNRNIKAEVQQAENNYLLFCEHPHVYTLGKSGTMQNLLIHEQEMKDKGVQFYRINRGGDITYHGPGQIVGYPIIDLEQFGLGIRTYIECLEEAVILTLKDFSIPAARFKSASGVWLDPGIPGKARKICAIGVRASRGVTMHGFAFNVNTDLSFYQYINPCGFTDYGVTSMEKEHGQRVDMEVVKEVLREKLMGLLQKQP